MTAKRGVGAGIMGIVIMYLALANALLGGWESLVISHVRRIVGVVSAEIRVSAQATQ